MIGLQNFAVRQMGVIRDRARAKAFAIRASAQMGSVHFA